MKMCMRCKINASASVDDPHIPPLCEECWELEGTPIAIGEEAILTVGGEIVTIKSFENGTWENSGLADVDWPNGGVGMVPLATLVPM